MGSTSGRRSSSSADSSRRRRVVIAGHATRDVRHGKNQTHAEARVKSHTQSHGRTSSDSPRRPSSAGKRVANSRRIERERRLRARRLRVRLTILAALVVTAGLVFGLASLYRSQVFEITATDVIGNDWLDAERVREIADIPTGSTLLRYPGREIKDRLESDPWIETVAVSRDFPDTLRLRITERVPVARVDVGGASSWLIDASGVMIAQHTPDATSTLVVIRDVEGLDPAVGRKTTSEALLNAIEVVGGLSSELSARTRAISAPSIDKTALITVDDIEIFLGSADELQKKDRIARQILEEQAGRVVYINVRTVDRPTWRGIDD